MIVAVLPLQDLRLDRIENRRRDRDNLRGLCVQRWLRYPSGGRLDDAGVVVLRFTIWMIVPDESVEQRVKMVVTILALNDLRLDGVEDRSRNGDHFGRRCFGRRLGDLNCVRLDRTIVVVLKIAARMIVPNKPIEQRIEMIMALLALDDLGLDRVEYRRR